MVLIPARRQRGTPHVSPHTKDHPRRQSHHQADKPTSDAARPARRNSLGEQRPLGRSTGRHRVPRRGGVVVVGLRGGGVQREAVEELESAQAVLELHSHGLDAGDVGGGGEDARGGRDPRRGQRGRARADGADGLAPAVAVDEHLAGPAQREERVLQERLEEPLGALGHDDAVEARGVGLRVRRCYALGEGLAHDGGHDAVLGQALLEGCCLLHGGCVGCGCQDADGKCGDCGEADAEDVQPGRLVVVVEGWVRCWRLDGQGGGDPPCKVVGDPVELRDDILTHDWGLDVAGLEADRVDQDLLLWRRE